MDNKVVPAPGRAENTLRKMVKQKGTIVAGLIDPEEFSTSEARKIAFEAEKAGVSVIFIGGSTIGDQHHLDQVVISVKNRVTIPVILFPGNITGVSRHADAILFSSLLNSDNPYFIVGAQSIGAIEVYRHRLEAIPMAYIVFSRGSTTGFVGQVREIPLDKPEIVVMYALTSRYMGMRALYLESGSGANTTIPPKLVKLVRKYFPGLLLIGGGIKEPETAMNLANAGADILVIGNLLETKDYKVQLQKIVKAIRSD